MNIQDFINYIKESDKISDKFDAINEITKKWLFFNGQGLMEINRSKFRVLNYRKRADGNYYILPAKNGDIVIAWEDDENNSYSIIVPKSFFKNFEKFLKEIQNEVSKNNKEQTERYQEYLRKIKEKKEQKQYQEFLRLKEIYEPQSL